MRFTWRALRVLLGVVLTCGFVAVWFGCRQTQAAAAVDPCNDWDFGQAVTRYTEFSFKGNTLSSGGDMAIDFVMDGGPRLAIGDDRRTLQFDSPMPAAEVPGKLVLIAPHAKGATAALPRFTALLTKTEGQLSYFTATAFAGYEEQYLLHFAVKLGGSGEMSIKKCNFFGDGSEHHIRGAVELFGAKFEPERAGGLTFRIDGKLYRHLSGKGSVTTKNGRVAFE